MDRSPLKEFIRKQKQFRPIKQKVEQDKDSVEDIVFSLILSVFIVTLLLSISPQQTGQVIYDEDTVNFDINQYYTQSENVSLELLGNITSLRISGEFIGSGYGQVYVNDILIIDSRDLVSGPSLITGYAVSLEDSNKTNESVVEINETIIENVSLDELTLSNVTNVTARVINISNNETKENLTIDITTNVTENISLNLTTNITQNITLNTTLNITQNLTQNISVNVTETNETVEVVTERKDFTYYCEDSCYINLPKDVVLRIVLNNVSLNLTRITYNYIVIEYEENITEVNVSQNITRNISQNITQNITLNESLNITEIVNITTNITANLSTNITTNISLNLTTNLTNVSINLTLNETNITFGEVFTIEDLSLLLSEKGLSLESYTLEKDIYSLEIVKDEDNYAFIETSNLSLVELDFLESKDKRLNSKIFVLRNTIAEVTLESSNPEVLLQCVQYEETCKKWKISEQRVSKSLKGIEAELEPGVYATADIDKVEKNYIPTNSVYYNSNCDSCGDVSDCSPENFCVMNNIVKGYDFEAQLDFDILNIDDSFEKAEVCGYLHYGEDENLFNYLKYSPESYCSDIRLGNSTSNLLSYRIVGGEGWTCIDATKIIRYAMDKDYSNVFVNWQGQDLNGESFPITCYRGVANLSQCGYYNPSGAEDCRPYLKLDYTNES